MKFVLYLVFYYLNFSAYILHVLIFFHGITLSFNTFFTCEHFKDDYKHMKYTVCGAKNHSNSKHDLCRNGFETICSKVSQSDHVLRVNDQTYAICLQLQNNMQQTHNIWCLRGEINDL